MDDKVAYTMDLRVEVRFAFSFLSILPIMMHYYGGTEILAKSCLKYYEQ